MITKKQNRRDFIKSSSLIAGAAMSAPFINCGKIGVSKPLTRPFGKFDFEVTTLGLGGQASLQWTPDDVDPVNIILKSFKLGVNYYDTSNLYGPSQANFGKAFQQLDLIPGKAGYNEKLRQSIWLTSKTHMRFAKGGYDIDGVWNWSNGGEASTAVTDLKRSLSLMFGDGKGNYPKGAYLDLMLIHSLSNFGDVEASRVGLVVTDASAEHIGALAALRDYRDGTNLTGLNPKEEKLLKHIGFSGHASAAAMMDMIQQDEDNLLEAVLISVNANDKLHFNMQNNVLPVLQAKNMGVIGMKVFADGAMYTKEARWSRTPEDVVRSVGSPDIPSRPLVEYALSTPEMHTAIIGIGQISDDPAKCQLEQNLSSAQINPNALSAQERHQIEMLASKAKEGKTNYFQQAARGLTAPQNIKFAIVQTEGDKANITVQWDTAFAGDAKLDRYDIFAGDIQVGTVEHKPQIDKTPFTFSTQISGDNLHAVRVVAVDKSEQSNSSEIITA